MNCKDCIWYEKCTFKDDVLCDDFYPVDEGQSEAYDENVYIDNTRDWINDEYDIISEEYF